MAVARPLVGACLRVVLLLAASSLKGQSSEESLRTVDRTRFPWPNFSVEVVLDDGKVQQVWKVLVRDNGDARVEGLSAKEQGRVILLLGEEMWLLLPNARRPVRVAPQQRLLGPAAGGDIARFRFASGYTVTEQREETMNGSTALRLDLQARNKNQSYRKAVLWLSGEGHPLRSDFFFASGKQARTARYGPIVQVQGTPVLSSLELEETSGQVARLSFSQWKPVKIEEGLFKLPD